MTKTHHLRPLRAVLQSGAGRLRAAGVETARLDARLLVGEALGLTREAMLIDPDRPVDAAEQAAVAALIERRAAREPVSRILGRREFWSLAFDLSPATLDPRPDTETVVEAALGLVPDRTAPLRILDLGTGTGCILLSLLSELPRATGLGIDRSTDAVAAAAWNADRLGLVDRARFQEGDWTVGLTEPFDLVVSNPPYITTAEIPTLAPEVAVFDPRAALDGGADGLEAFRRIAIGLASVLKPGAAAVLEMGAGQGAAVSALFAARGYRQVRMAQDLAGHDRCLIVETLR